MNKKKKPEVCFKDENETDNKRGLFEIEEK